MNTEMLTRKGIEHQAAGHNQYAAAKVEVDLAATREAELLQQLANLEGQSFPQSDLDARVKETIERLLQDAVVKAGFAKLEKELPQGLCYHNKTHSEEALEWGVRLALKDELSSEQILLIAKAIAWHDTGFIVRRNANEVIGAEMVAEAMQRNGDSQEDIAAVVEMIRATELKPTINRVTIEQQPTSFLSRYVLDADLSNFGRECFLEKTVLVFNEMLNKDKLNILQLLVSDEGRCYLEGTTRLMTQHVWHTKAAKELLGEGKKDNVARLVALLVPPVL